MSEARAWDVADREIGRCLQAMERAERGGRANIAVCRAQIDKWLEYRRNHGPGDEPARL